LRNAKIPGELTTLVLTTLITLAAATASPVTIVEEPPVLPPVEALLLPVSALVEAVFETSALLLSVIVVEALLGVVTLLLFTSFWEPAVETALPVPTEALPEGA
jgi:hypothetical protein